MTRKIHSTCLLILNMVVKKKTPPGSLKNKVDVWHSVTSMCSDSVSSALCLRIKAWNKFLFFPGGDWITRTQGRRWSRGAKGSIRSPRRCWSSWPHWWEGKLLLPVWLLNFTLIKQNKNPSCYFVSSVMFDIWSRMVAQQGLTRKIVFPIGLLWTATDFSLLLLLNQLRG